MGGDVVDTDQPTVRNADCRHPKADHYHGTLGSYISDRCRCDDCRNANEIYGRHRRRRVAGLALPDFHLGEYWKPGSPEWLKAMRAGLRQAVVESIKRHGVVG